MNWVNSSKVTDMLALTCKCRNKKKKIFGKFYKEVWLDLLYITLVQVIFQKGKEVGHGQAKHENTLSLPIPSLSNWFDMIWEGTLSVVYDPSVSFLLPL